MISIAPFWVWLIIALACLLVELLLLPTTGFLLCFAVCAGIMAGLAAVIPLSVSAMLAWFGGLTVCSLIIWWVWLYKRIPTQDANSLNDATGRLVGYKGTITDSVVSGRGRMQVGDTTWIVEAQEDYPVGTPVVVVQAKGIVLVVKKTE